MSQENALLERAIRRQRAGDLEGAEALYRDLLERDPRNLCAQVNLGDLCRARGRFEEAKGCFERALAEQPDLAPVHGHLAAALHALGRHGEAEGHHRRAADALAAFVAEREASCHAARA